MTLYQYYYSKENNDKLNVTKSVEDYFKIDKVRVTMWEEHCLECAAPLCYDTCLNYVARQDGRCKLFKDSISQSNNDKALLGKCARVKFRKWGNLLSIVFPKMVTMDDYIKIDKSADKVSKRLLKTVNGCLPTSIKWKKIRISEFIRRKNLRKGLEDSSDAFILHCYNHKNDCFKLFLEIFDEEHHSLFKYGFPIEPGENLHILPSNKYNDSCDKSGNLIKIYPEDNCEADVTFLWSDFVKGTQITSRKPADKVKLVVWDLDNTLWDGILIEHNENVPLELKENVIDTIKALDERGIVQSISSKNDYEPAMAMLKKLGIDEYFLYPQINWNPKSDSLMNIVNNLNINIDTVAFIDDSDFERAQVSSVLPQVRVYKETDIANLLKEEPFDVMITTESKNRRAMYKAEEKRNQIKSSYSTNIEDFIKQCQLKINIFTPTTDEELLRCYELVLRTNQLNMSGIKYTREEFEIVVNQNNAKTFAFSCKDMFGKYGIVGFIQYEVNDSKFVFKEFAMSCRVAGKFVESALFKYLLENENLSEGYFSVNITEKNSLLRRTLEDIGFVSINRNNKKIDYKFTTELKNSDLVEVKG